MDQQAKDAILLIVVTTALIIFFVALVINLLLYARNRKLKHRAEVQDLKLTFEKEIISTRLEVTEITLAEISADLHDDVGQMLTVAILELNRLTGADEARNAVRASLDSIRSISKIMNPEYFKNVGLSDAILRLAERINKQGKIKVDVFFDESVYWKDLNHEIYVFRIIQELVTNTLKYAEASQIFIRFEREVNGHLIKYSDDGIGMNNPLDVEPTGLGMLNIFRRVHVLHGTINIETKPGLGFMASIRFPDSGTMAKFGD